MKELYGIKFKVPKDKSKLHGSIAWVDLKTGEILVSSELLTKYKKYLPYFLFHEKGHLSFPDTGSTFEDEYVAHCYAIRKAIENKVPIPWELLRRHIDKRLFSLIRAYYKKLIEKEE